MKTYYESLRTLFKPEDIISLSKVVEEPEERVDAAVSTVIAGLMVILGRQDSPLQVQEILEEAGKLEILPDIIKICQEEITLPQQRVGDALLEFLLGDRAAEFTDLIAQSTGMSKVGVNRIIAIIAPVIAGFLGKELLQVKELPRLLEEIREQKERYIHFVPAEITDAFRASEIAEMEEEGNELLEVPDLKETKVGRNWRWLAVILILLAIIFIIWKN